MTKACLVTLTLVLASAGLGATDASAYVYWANNGTNALGRVSLDGTGANQSFLTDPTSPRGPAGVAVDGAHIYWTNYTSGAIGRANLDGTNADPNFITGARSPFSVVVDGGHIYWTSFGPSTGAGTIGRADLNGTNVNQNFITAAGYPYGLATDGSHIYWTDQMDWIGRASLDGTVVERNFIATPTEPWGLAVDGAHMYWATFDGNSIARANLDGTGMTQSFITGGDHTLGVAVDALHVYWTNGYSGVGRANIDGTGANQTFVTGASSPRGVAVDALPTAGSPSPPPPPGPPAPPAPPPPVAPPPCPRPVVRTLTAGSVSGYAARLRGSVDPIGGAGAGCSATYQFEYGSSTRYGASTTVRALPAVGGPVPVSADVRGLTPGRTYHFRLVAVSSNSVSRVVVTGGDRLFRARVPTRVTLSVLPRRQARVPYVFQLSGRVRYAGPLPRRVACQGSVALKVTQGSRARVYAAGSTGLRSDCTFAGAVRLPASITLGTYSVGAQFSGNRNVTGGSAKHVAIKVG